MDYTQHYDSPLDQIILASDGNALIGLWFDDQNYYCVYLLSSHIEKKIPIFDETIKWLDIYFTGKGPDFTPKFKKRTTDFP